MLLSPSSGLPQLPPCPQLPRELQLPQFFQQPVEILLPRCTASPQLTLHQTFVPNAFQPKWKQNCWSCWHQEGTAGAAGRGRATRGPAPQGEEPQAEGLGCVLAGRLILNTDFISKSF